jgi:hypothetical protein
MLIDFSRVCEQLQKDEIKINGILHVGAHTCEELPSYIKGGVSEDRIYWIESNHQLVQKSKVKKYD